MNKKESKWTLFIEYLHKHAKPAAQTGKVAEDLQKASREKVIWTSLSILHPLYFLYLLSLSFFIFLLLISLIILI